MSEKEEEHGMQEQQYMLLAVKARYSDLKSYVEMSQLSSRVAAVVGERRDCDDEHDMEMETTRSRWSTGRHSQFITGPSSDKD
jgi:hypothetical protein